jgi:hypothetical protein
VTQEVVRLVLAPEIDYRAFVQHFTSLRPFAVIELVTMAAAGWMSPWWRSRVFVAAFLTPMSLLTYVYPLWHAPLTIIAVLSATHFAVLLAIFSVSFGFKRLLRRRTAC